MPAIIFGLVLDRDTYTSTLGNQPREIPTLRILDDDLTTEWGVMGFHGWLGRGIEKENPRVGDYVLISFTGIKKARKDGNSDAFTYEVIVERNPANAVELPVVDGSVDTTTGEQPVSADEPEQRPSSQLGPDDDVPF